MNEIMENGRGVYGIYIDDELVYIGSTTSSFCDRFNGHLRSIEGRKKRQLVHYGILDAKHNGQHVEMRILINVDTLHYKGRQIDGRDIQAMEYALITEHKPKYNVQGVKEPFVFNAKRKEEEISFDF